MVSSAFRIISSLFYWCSNDLRDGVVVLCCLDQGHASNVQCHHLCAALSIFEKILHFYVC